MKLYLASDDADELPGSILDLAGENQRAAIVANAIDGVGETRRSAAVSHEIERLRVLGFESEVMDLRQYFDRTRNLEDELSRFGLIWVMGGNAFVLRRAVRYSGLDVLLPRHLDESRLAYGGYSAGAVMAAPTLHGIDLVDDPTDVPPFYQKAVIWSGLGLVPYRIAPHFRSRNPQTHEIERVVEYFVRQGVPYRTLSDGQALLIDGAAEHLLDSRTPEMRALEDSDPLDWSITQLQADGENRIDIRRAQNGA